MRSHALLVIYNLRKTSVDHSFRGNTKKGSEDQHHLVYIHCASQGHLIWLEISESKIGPTPSLLIMGFVLLKASASRYNVPITKEWKFMYSKN